MNRRRLAAFSGSLTAFAGLVLAAPATDAATYTPSNSTQFTITTTTTTPSSTIIELYGAATTISDVNVTLTSVNHNNADDLDIELVGPDGTAVALMSDACGTSIAATITLDDQASVPLPDSGPCPVGSYKASNYAPSDTWAEPPTDPTLAAFNTKRANGQWTLYVGDDSSGSGAGTISGWSLTITTAATAALAVPGPASSAGSGVANPYPLPITVSGMTGQITDVNLVLPGLTHTDPDDLDILLVAPGGAKALVMSDVCGADADNVTLTLDDQAAAELPALAVCPTGSYRPRDNGVPQDTMEAPAPAGPHATTMAAFNGASPNGVWNLYVRDDGTNFDTGWLLGAPTVQVTTTTGGFNGNSAPDTILTKKPRSSTKTSAKVTFTSTEASTFECKLDKKKWKSCTSPFKVRHLKVGKHKLQVRATDLAGLVDASPAKVTWKVKKP
jgi:subtilisin-like proprotein convertase family protein